LNYVQYIELRQHGKIDLSIRYERNWKYARNKFWRWKN
jgi:hypothetical protein